MTLRMRLRIAAIAAIAAAGLMAGVAVAVTNHMNEPHVHAGNNDTHVLQAKLAAGVFAVVDADGKIYRAE
jgi:hypothetical protein